MDIDNADFRGAGGDRIRSRIWDDVQPLLEEWAGVELTPSALYGLRVFRNGALIPPHVDDLPFVMSVVIHVADEVKEPWVMEMIGHDGRSYSVTMEAGDMLFYEGHSVIHGNPFPMKGMFYSVCPCYYFVYLCVCLLCVIFSILVECVLWL